MAKYKVKHTSIMHNCKVYAEGSLIELTDIQAKRLDDFVELVPGTEKTPAQPKTQTSKTSTKKPETPVKDETKTKQKEENKEGGVKDDK